MLCEWIKKQHRVHIDLSTAIIAEQRRLRVPFAVVKQHDTVPQGQERETILKALHKVCRQVYGLYYYIDAWSWKKRGHWYALGRQVHKTTVSRKPVYFFAGQACADKLGTSSNYDSDLEVLVV